MRKILFRAKRTDNKEWIEGSYIKSVVAASPFGYITPSYPTEPTQIYTVTLGQWTGLTDKNGKRIFEGDIVKMHLMDFADIGFIRYANDTCRFQFVDKCSIGYGFDDTDVMEVIGNVYDNPELLEGDK